MAKVFGLLLATSLTLTVPLFLLQVQTAAYAGTWEDIRYAAKGAPTDIWLKANSEREQFKKVVERRRSEFLQKFEFYQGNIKTAISRCDRAFYEASRIVARKFKNRKKDEIRLSLKLIEKEIPKKKQRATDLKNKYNSYYKQLDELTVLQRVTTGRHKELLDLAVNALIERTKADALLGNAESKNKQLDNLLLFHFRHFWSPPNFPKNCTSPKTAPGRQSAGPGMIRTSQPPTLTR